MTDSLTTDQLLDSTETSSSETDAKPFVVAAGTVMGQDHIAVGRNNQDGYYINILDDGTIIGVVCDGCGGDNTNHNEVGAKLGARLIVETIATNMDFMSFGPLAGKILLSHVKKMTIQRLNQLTDLIGRTKNKDGVLSRTQTVCDYFLFTTVGFIITKERTIVFSLGDGIAALNGEVKVIEPPAPTGPDDVGNKPLYLAYAGMVQTTTAEHSNPDFDILWDVPTETVTSLLVGCDGVVTIHKNPEAKIPGKQAEIGPLSQFWEKNDFFTNPFAVSRRLNQMNKSGSRFQAGAAVENYKSVLHDDTTLIVVRRSL